MGLRLQVGRHYKTLGGNTILIVEFEGQGRKPFIGKQVAPEATDQPIRYFRNGSFSNASRVKGGHPLDIREEISTD